MKILITVLILSIAAGVNASELGDVSPRIFYSYESNGGDYISSIGVGTSFKPYQNNLGVQFNTSIGHAEVLASDGYLEEYTSWEVSAKLGYFSDATFYVEAGFDLGEAIFQELRYSDDDYCYDDRYCYRDNVDAFVGMGAGVSAGVLQIEGIVRLREIDSEYWEARSEVFSGVQFSINF